MNIIDGKKVAQELKDAVKEEVEAIDTLNHIKPSLTVIQVGNNPASSTYVKNKEKACQYCGIEVITEHLDESISEKELLSIIDYYNGDRLCNGILVQLPLPKHIDEQNILNAIDPDKDVDGFHPVNVAKLWTNDKTAIIPCTPKGIMKLIYSVKSNISGLDATVIGRSNIVGKPIAKLLLDAGCTVTICHSKTSEVSLEEYCTGSDIVVCAVGKPKFLKYPSGGGSMGIMIDVGINRDENGKLVGDIDEKYIENHYNIDFITPVPGGVGPMTIACLMENTLECFKRQNNIKVIDMKK